jgi:hypothetical protein
VFSQALRDVSMNRQHNAPESGPFVVGALAVNAAVVVCFLVAGVKTLLLLKRPEIRNAFRR